MTEQHRNHAKRIVTADYRPRNVPLTKTHELVRCGCTFFGWMPKEEA